MSLETEVRYRTVRHTMLVERSKLDREIRKLEASTVGYQARPLPVALASLVGAYQSPGCTISDPVA